MFRKLVDTNILYDAFTENQNTEKALQVLNQPICIFDGVLYELSNLLKNTVDSQFSVYTIQDILDNKKIFKVLTSSFEEKNIALQIMQKYQTATPKKDFSFCDSIQLVLAEKYGLVLFTTDLRMTFYDFKKAEVVKPY